MSNPTLTVKDFDPSEQPREKALAYGCGVLTTAELWAIILRVGIPGTPITTLCRNLMNSVGGKLRHLERLDREALMTIDGIGTAKSLQIDAVMELIRRYSTEQLDEKPKITTSEDIYKIIAPRISNLDHEEVWALFLNRMNRVEEVRQFTRGSSVASIFDVKSIIRHALLIKAEGIVLCHNHPSGNLLPSIQDDQITTKLHKACQIFDLRLLDHIIATSTSFYSYHEKGKL